MKKERIKIYAGVITLVAALTGGSLVLYDSTIDHTTEVCPFTAILGPNHQINKINSDANKKNGITGEYMEQEYAPSGYVVNGDTAVKYQTIQDNDTDEYTLTSEKVTSLSTAECAVVKQDGKVRNILILKRK